MPHKLYILKSPNVYWKTDVDIQQTNALFETTTAHTRQQSLNLKPKTWMQIRLQVMNLNTILHSADVMVQHIQFHLSEGKKYTLK